MEYEIITMDGLWEEQVRALGLPDDPQGTMTTAEVMTTAWEDFLHEAAIESRPLRPILSIDPFERVQPDPLNPQGRYADYLANVLHHGVADVCLPLVAFSAQATPVVPACIGLLIVDGSHHYPDVRQDLHLYGPKVLPGGLMFIDDYVEAYPGVRQAVDEYFSPSAPWTILHKSWFVIARRTSGPTSNR